MRGFASGVGGVCICVLAIMGTIMCGFFLGVEETVSTSTQYSLTADTTGLFDTYESKRYIDFSPAANWTGYREKDGTADVTGGITYSTSAKINTYPITKDLQYLTSKTFSLREYTLPQADPPGYKGDGTVTGIMVYKSQRLSNVTEMTDYILNPRVSTVSDFLAQFTTTLTGAYADWTELVIQFQDPDSSTVYGTCAPLSDWYQNWIAWTKTGNYQKAAFLPYDELMECYYIKVDNTYTVIAYDADGTELWKCPAGSAGIVYGQVDSSSTYPTTTYTGDVSTLQSSLKIGIYGDPVTTYMDVSKGVRLAEATSGLSYADWTNGYQNGKIDILCTWLSGYDVNDVYLDIPVNFREVPYVTGYLKTMDLTILFRHYGNTSGNVYSTAIYTIKDGQTLRIDGTGNYTKGALLSLDFTNDRVEIYGVESFRTFQDYTLMASPGMSIDSYFSTLANFDTQVTPGTISADKIRFSGYNVAGDDLSACPNMGIVDTSIYMGDNALMMTNPTIAPVTLWPGVTQWEMRFYSFAVEGESLTITGPTGVIANYPVQNGKLIIDDQGHALTDVRVRAAWAGYGDDDTSKWRVWILFASETPTREIYVGDAGSDYSKSGPVIKWNGFWYFTSAFYTGQEVASSNYTLDFQHFIFDSNAAILCYLGLLILGTIILKRMSGLGAYDMIVLVFAGVCGFVLMA